MSDCGTEYTWYAANCSQCGKDLAYLKPYSNAFDASVFSMLKK